MKSWTVEDLRPVATELLDDFGPQRLMFGSDWPVCRVAGGWAAVGLSRRGTAHSPVVRENSTRSYPALPDVRTVGHMLLTELLHPEILAA